MVLQCFLTSFVDYNLLFCRANIVEKCALKYLINIYAHASTHQINMEKTTLLISKNFGEDEVNAIKAL